MKKIIHILIAILLIGSNSYAQNNKNVALIIGNSSYEQYNWELDGVVNDVNIISETFVDLGFFVDKKINLDFNSLNDVIDNFIGKNNYETIIFYYAGLAENVNGIDYIIPIDVEIKNEADIINKCYSLELFLKKLNNIPNASKIIFWDASRINDFNNNDIGQGYKLLPQNTTLFFSTKLGKVAADKSGYAQCLAKQIKKNTDLETVFTNVASDMLNYNTIQKPEIISNYNIENFYLHRINNADKNPPQIKITSPNVTRGFKPVVQENKVIITGKVTDVSGIFDVSINGEPANVDAQGNFSKTVLLAFGDNSFTVTATDIKQNTSTETFVIERNSNQNIAT